ncbi:MAG: FG-GAP repeat protein [Acidobacteriota bacterium]
MHPGHSSLLLPILLLALPAQGGSPCDLPARMQELVPEVDRRLQYLGFSADLLPTRTALGSPGDHRQAFQAGSVQVYEYLEDDWGPATNVEDASPVADDLFGYDVALDGHRLLVGAPGRDEVARDSGVAILYERSRGSWIEEARLVGSALAAHDAFGHAVALSGDWALVGAPGARDDAGEAYLFHHDGAEWREVERFVSPTDGPGSAFGWSVAVAEGVAVVAAPFEDPRAAGDVHVFTPTVPAGNWVLEASLQPDDSDWNEEFGWSVATDGTHVAVGAPSHGTDQRGALFLFERDEATGAWGQVASEAPDDAGPRLGHSVDVVNGLAVVASPLDYAGVFLLRRRALGDWIVEDQFFDARSLFGSAVALQDRQLLVGAPGLGIFRRGGGLHHRYPGEAHWAEDASLWVAQEPVPESYGSAVLLHGSWAFVAASEDDTAVTLSGSVTVFRQRDPATWEMTQRITTPVPDAFDRLGTDMVAEGNLLVLAGRADTFVYELSPDTETWELLQVLDPSVGDKRGALSLRGDELWIGNPWHDGSDGMSTGAIFMYERDPATGLFDETRVLLPPDPDPDFRERFGQVLARSADLFVVGLHDEVEHRYCLIYERAGDDWVVTQRLDPLSLSLCPTTTIGEQVVVTDDRILLTTARCSSRVLVLERESPGGAWVLTGEVALPETASDDELSALAYENGTIVFGTGERPRQHYSEEGSVHVAVEGPSGWEVQRSLRPEDLVPAPYTPSPTAYYYSPGFGWSIDLEDGRLLIGAMGGNGIGYGTGSAYLTCVVSAEDCANFTDDDDDELADCADFDCVHSIDCIDSDEDGIRDLEDCAPDDRFVFGLPGDLETMTVRRHSSGGVELTWRDQGPEVGLRLFHHVVHGRLDDLSAMGTSAATCVEPSHVGDTYLDATGLDESRYYLVRAWNSCGPAGDDGWGRSDEPRSPSCP